MTVRQTNGPQAPGDQPSAPTAKRSAVTAMARGFAHKCPACGSGRLYTSFLKVTDNCQMCGEDLHHQRADDAPPYLTMFITAHVLVAGALILERSMAPPTWVHAAIWLPLTVVLTYILLPRVKGALIGLQWALRMHGFDGDPQEVDDGGLRPRDSE